jgi:hypothetical protein
MPKKGIPFGWVTAGAVVLVVGFFWWGNDTVSHKTNRELALSCTTDMFTTFHIHPYLEIMVNGRRQEIPANTGVTLGCMSALHTHDSTGKIHVESPERRDFTLGDFFAVWNKPFSKDQILDYTVDGTHVLTVTVNGKAIDTYENTILRDEDTIVISYEPQK